MLVSELGESLQKESLKYTMKCLPTDDKLSKLIVIIANIYQILYQVYMGTLIIFSLYTDSSCFLLGIPSTHTHTHTLLQQAVASTRW